MISAHRSHRHFNIPRTFDVDKYLDEQLAAQAEEKRQSEWEQFHGQPWISVDDPKPEQQRQMSQQLESLETRFRGWAVRLNARIERRMDSVDWKQIDMRLGTIGGFALTGFIVYMAWTLADAWLQGRFNLGAN